MADGTSGTARNPFLEGNFAPVEREIDAENLKVSGALPAGLKGTLYRNGPNPRFPSPDAHWFVGDGMLHAFELDGGRARYRNRWVRTPRWLAEDKAERSLYNGFGGRRPDAPDWATHDMGVANTHVVSHAGRLLALEEAHPPTRIEPDSLATLGYEAFGAQEAAFTAHPKIDPANGEMLFFNYNAAGPFTPTIRFGVVGADGSLLRQQFIEAPYASMIHDFMVTERHVLFPVLPLTGSMDRAMRGQPPFAWEPAKGAFVGVLRRDGSEPIRWFQGDPCYVFHIMNAWDDGDRIVAEVMASAHAPLFPHADGAPPSPSPARLTRWTIDMAGGGDRFVEDRLDDLPGEFPRIDDRWAGRRHRHGWFACDSAAAASFSFDGLVHRDRATGEQRTWMLPAGDAISEPVFAARGEAEGDGWILAVAWRAAEQRSELLVFEATDLEAGPVAAVEAPQRTPFGFHGSWVGKVA